MTLEYWLTREATGENGHLNYLGLGEHERKRSEWLVEQVKSMNIPIAASILEVGCGCGRNLWHLMRAGYPNVYGIEANRDRVDVARWFERG